MTRLSVRLPDDLRTALTTAMREAHRTTGLPVTRSSVVLAALRAYLDGRTPLPFRPAQ